MEHVSSWFQSALLPEKWDVCGVICKSLSIWHVFVLSQVRNAFYCGGEISMDSASELLMYCSQGHADGARLYSDPIHRARVIKRIYKKLSKHNLDEVDSAINDYLSSCLRVPSHKQKEQKGGGRSTAAAPIAYVLVDAFCSMGIEKAWDMPYSTAICLFDARRDVNGQDDTLETLDEERRYDDIEARKREAKAKQRAKEAEELKEKQT